MQIILTHEQADFDALASMLGAYLLNESAIPVLPRRMNRNVRAFLSLYGAELPFIDPRDLPAETVESIILVDTQSMVSVKGAGPQTRVQVIDHHPSKENLPENWSLTLVEIGATTSLLIEALHDHLANLTPIQATLLLLGIYEDTGSLTYTRTTGRDLRAAACLLEQGASLQVANNFLNHPLSQAQQALYGRLRDNIEHLHIHGNTIILACGNAQELDEELSTLAHKLRDLLDPDAIFLIVTTRGGVQIIARSTSDNIDVAEIVANFGGGGHERAAASLVRDMDLESVRDKLVRLLPDYVHPAVKVAQIMSSRPQLLQPDTTVEEAAERMRRYGYEGFPVVKHGRVVGLLTRRSVDRALSHRYSKSISSLMEAGSYTVSPNDSIEDVQRLVTETGWGQIPVVDPDTQAIVGIVTRTDLLKTLTPTSKLPGRMNLASRLEAALPPDRLALLKAIASTAARQHTAVYIVGGFVRDILLERPSLDFDLVVEGDAIALARMLVKQYGGRATSHARFGTTKWHLQGVKLPDGKEELSIAGLDSLDLVSARTEFYTHPTALPTVESGSIKLDLHRRDFTINTLAMRLDGNHYGQLHDYWGGLEDLHSGILRVLHSLSFVDDPTRILRAARFEQRFGFRIEERTMELLIEARPLIERLTGDRIRHELAHILETPVAPDIFERLHTLGCLQPIHPDLTWDDWLSDMFANLEALQPDEIWKLGGYKKRSELKHDLSFVFWTMRLSSVSTRQISERLKIRVGLVKEILAGNRLYQERHKLTSGRPSQLTQFLDEFTPLSIYAFSVADPDTQVSRVLHSYASRWREIRPSVDGHTLRQMGIKPGPVYRELLTRLRAAWLDGELSSEGDELLLLQALLAQHSHQ